MVPRAANQREGLPFAGRYYGVIKKRVATKLLRGVFCVVAPRRLLKGRCREGQNGVPWTIADTDYNVVRSYLL